MDLPENILDLFKAPDASSTFKPLTAEELRAALQELAPKPPDWYGPSPKP